MTQSNGKNQPDIKLIVLDLDGTLLNSKHELSARNEAALKAAMAEGVKVVLATGKTRNAGVKLVETLGLTTPGIYLQGLVIYEPDGEISFQQLLEPWVARQVLTFGTERGFKFIAYSGSRMMIPSHDPDIVAGLMRYHEPAAEVVGPLVNLTGKVSLNKLMAIGPDARSIRALRWQLEAQLGSSARIMQAGIPNMLEVLPPGACKGTALRHLLDNRMHLDRRHVMAMGDAENDHEMLELAGLGVAIGNADAALKKIANEVVGTNDEDGVAEAVERFVLKRKLDVPATGEAETMIEPGGEPLVEPKSADEESRSED
jgi:Cof subfamily protein (haloacid dehalogenase superfamily)